MGKGKELTNEKRQMVVDLHKSGNGYKTIAKKLNIPLTTIRAIIKKFKTTGTVVNLPGRGRKCILPPRTVRQMVREAKGNPRATVGELQNLVASWGHQVSKSTIRCHLLPISYLEGLPEKKSVLRATNKCKRLEFALALQLEPGAMVR